MNCPRCSNTMIADTFTDLMDDSGVLGITAWRCLTCGEVVDPVIMANRANRPEPFVSKSRKNWGS
ncbi:MAG: hypothetical protein OEY97_00915 [Nitrospirota bacterium]|nr:hypothetical protein [Nitrospirota bacterium]